MSAAGDELGGQRAGGRAGAGGRRHEAVDVGLARLGDQEVAGLQRGAADDGALFDQREVGDLLVRRVLQQDRERACAVVAGRGRPEQHDVVLGDRHATQRLVGVDRQQHVARLQREAAAPAADHHAAADLVQPGEVGIAVGSEAVDVEDARERARRGAAARAPGSGRRT